MVTLTAEQQNVVEAVLQGNNVVVVGPPFSGKGTAIRAAFDELKKRGIPSMLRTKFSPITVAERQRQGLFSQVTPFLDVVCVLSPVDQFSQYLEVQRFVIATTTFLQSELPSAVMVKLTEPFPPCDPLCAQAEDFLLGNTKTPPKPSLVTNMPAVLDVFQSPTSTVVLPDDIHAAEAHRALTRIVCDRKTSDGRICAMFSPTIISAFRNKVWTPTSVFQCSLQRPPLRELEKHFQDHGLSVVAFPWTNVAKREVKNLVAVRALTSAAKMSNDSRRLSFVAKTLEAPWSLYAESAEETDGALPLEVPPLFLFQGAQVQYRSTMMRGVVTGFATEPVTGWNTEIMAKFEETSLLKPPAVLPVVRFYQGGSRIVLPEKSQYQDPRLGLSINHFAFPLTLSYSTVTTDLPPSSLYSRQSVIVDPYLFYMSSRAAWSFRYLLHRISWSNIRFTSKPQWTLLRQVFQKT